jgi:arginase
MPFDLSLLLTEWQGAGGPSEVSTGARALAAGLPAAGFVEIEAPPAESLPLQDGVIGLESIASRLGRTASVIAGRQPARIFTAGGTCGVEVAPVSYLNARYRGDLAVLWLDAHADLNTPQSSPSGRFHGMVLRTLMGTGPASIVRQIERPLSAEQILLAGARDFDRDEAAFVSDAPVAWLRPADLLVPDRAAGRLRARGFRRAYIHFDLDVLDPVEWPHALVPSPGGVPIDAIAETIQQVFRAFDVVGFSVVEFCPRSVDAVPRLVRLLARCGVP